MDFANDGWGMLTHSPAFPGRELIAGTGSDGTHGKNGTALQGLIFSKSRVHSYGQNLGKGGLAHRKPEPN